MRRAADGGFDAVLFDLDGTLVDTAGEIHAAVNDTLHGLGLPAASLADVRDWIGHGTGELLLQALAAATGSGIGQVRGSALHRLAGARFAADYERHCGTCSRPYPHAAEVLDALGRAGVRRAVVTNKEARFTDPVLRRHGLSGLLEHVVCGDTAAARKPDPAGVRQCLAALGVPASRALFVGDSRIDVDTARRAGLPVWAVTYGYNRGEPIARAEPDRLLDDLQPLLAHLPA